MAQATLFLVEKRKPGQRKFDYAVAGEWTANRAKRCSSCQKEKPIGEFHRTKKSADGRFWWCRQCCNDRATNEPPADYQKQCAGCGIVKPAADFSTKRSNKDGLNRLCRPCHANQQRRCRLNRVKRNSELVIDPNETKVCGKCKVTKPVSAFYRKGDASRGISAWCIECHNAKGRTSRVRRIAKNLESPPAVTAKQCASCRQFKPASAFWIRRDSGDGLCSSCKPCMTANMRARQQALREKRLAVRALLKEKLCPRCKTVKPAAAFSKDAWCRDGLRYFCQDCDRERQRRHWSSLRNYLRHLLLAASGRCSSRGWDIDFDVDYLVELWHRQGGVCPYTGLPMTHEQRAKRDAPRFTNVSLDRINSDEKYVRGNIQLVCYWANVAKGAMTDRDFRNFLRLAGAYQLAAEPS